MVGRNNIGSKRVLADFLLEHGIDTIDLLILTHLHQDHFGGFYNLIDKIKVVKAVVPYGDIVFNEAVYDYYANEQFFREYHEVFKYFKKSQTEIIDTYQSFRTEFEFGPNKLRCIYPLSIEGMKIPDCLDKLCSDGLSIPEMKEYCDIFRENCNEESSIWALENQEECIGIFAGDSSIETMRTAFMAYGKRPRILKLSHHGIGAQYFDGEQLEMLGPKEVVVCNSEEFFPVIKNDCENACKGINTKIHYTFKGNYELIF